MNWEGRAAEVAELLYGELTEHDRDKIAIRDIAIFDLVEHPDRKGFRKALKSAIKVRRAQHLNHIPGE